MTTRPLPAVASLADDLPTWLPAQRWFAAKGRDVSTVQVERAAVLWEGADPGAPSLLHALVDADGERYQLLLGVVEEVPEHLRGATVGRLEDGSFAYDATHDAELMGGLLELFATRSAAGGVDWLPEPGVEIHPGLRARPIGVEQSNTSIVFGEHYILKVYRRPVPGESRDVELHRALAGAGSTRVAAPVAVMRTEDTVLGFAQRFLGDAAEGWATATASVRDLLAEADLHAGEVGGDFAGEAHRLGAAVAEVHAALATALGTEPVGPAEMMAGADEMHARLDAAVREVPALAEHEPVLRAAFDAVRGLPGTTVQQVHGDLHLGQVLRTTTGWVLIDFEGEPDAPPAERVRARSPLRDVAGMLRSFDYAALHLLAGEEPDHQRLTRAAEWADRNRSAFCDGYATVGPDPRLDAVLLRAFELDKAVYEVGYEHRNRPDWVPIPLAAISRVAAAG
ncbi:maltokinase N-terminal cap-like domain-containing protein [Actinokineospora globicatena]|uniref:maltokinase N-terminal cap-like domain-containing protein n=1 Tax=Actinokineospora globicatena TaxID=103729 RepID=UPI0020A37839|nr:aminoglycoside phosphotransferase [Actinokineospora globicatena]MCP2305439.1 maltokinase [Actinokineospora globicatena]GLW81307.1 aminoglycoside phosphotransferase [Actinokineospora globicatena]GLW87995.1 aminoglycoside phosphotransferase [Actinokineospora globicatena]